MIKNKDLGLFFSYVKMRRTKIFCLFVEILMFEKLKNGLFQMVRHTKMMLNAKIPVFSWSSQPFSAEEIATIILGKYDDEVLCKSLPINVSHNVTFLVDTRKLCQPNDFKCVDMGAWRNNGVRKKRVFVKFDCHNDTATVDLSADSKDHSLYALKRSYHKNKSSEDVKKIIAMLEGK